MYLIVCVCVGAVGGLPCDLGLLQFVGLALVLISVWIFLVGVLGCWLCLSWGLVCCLILLIVLRCFFLGLLRVLCLMTCWVIALWCCVVLLAMGLSVVLGVVSLNFRCGFQGCVWLLVLTCGLFWVVWWGVLWRLILWCFGWWVAVIVDFMVC